MRFALPDPAEDRPRDRLRGVPLCLLASWLLGVEYDPPDAPGGGGQTNSLSASTCVIRGKPFPVSPPATGLEIAFRRGPQQGEGICR